MALVGCIAGRGGSVSFVLYLRSISVLPLGNVSSLSLFVAGLLFNLLGTPQRGVPFVLGRPRVVFLFPYWFTQ